MPSRSPWPALASRSSRSGRTGRGTSSCTARPLPWWRQRSRQASRRDAAMTAHSNLLLVDGLRWPVTERGQGHTVLLTHGFTGRGTSWGRHATALAARFRVVMPDLPGHGRTAIATDPSRASVERSADDLGAILARRAFAPASVVGYSLGARIALRLAVTRPELVRRLV